jgi:hypothetical protein
MNCRQFAPAILTLFVSAWTTSAPATEEHPLLRCGVDLDLKVLPADTPQTAVIKITLDAPRPKGGTAPGQPGYRAGPVRIHVRQ